MSICAALISSVALANAAPKAKVSAHIAAAQKAEHRKDFPTAEMEYRQARTDDPTSVDAALGTARNEEAQGHLVIAYATYQAILSDPSLHLSKAQRTTVATRLATIGERTATLVLHVAPEGTTVNVDGAAVGVSPIHDAIRVMAGSRVIEATKPDFVPEKQTFKMAGGTERTINVTLAAEVKTGAVTVRDAGDRVLTVRIDGVESGVTPWSGELSPGDHLFEAYDVVWSDTAKTVHVDKGGKVGVVLSGAARDGGVELVTNDQVDLIRLDGALVGEGSYSGRVGLGPHRVAFSREGYKPTETDIDVKEGATVRVEAKLAPIPKAPEELHEIGMVSHLDVAGSIQINQVGSESETNCAALGKNCSESTKGGFGVFFGFGHMWKWIGFDTDFGFTGDSGRRHYDKADGTSVPYYFDRLGAVQAVRLRAAVQNDDLRGVVAVGPGITEKYAMIGYGDKAAPSSIQDYAVYISPGLDLDLRAEWRFTKSTALAVGARLWIETAGSSTSSPKGPSPGDFHIVSGTQTMIYPYIGLDFGP